MSFEALVEQAEAAFRAGDHAGALSAWRAAWPLSRGVLEPVPRVWLLLSLATAAVRAGDFDEAFEALAGLQKGFADTKVVVGNPWFHLLVGLTFAGLRDSPEQMTDNFARALICGGSELFTDEDPQFLAAMKRLLKPPAELGTWDGYRGCSRALLNGATGPLRDLLTHRLGAPPPYSD